MINTITLTGDYGYSSYRYSGGDADVIDASAASWIVANTGSPTNCYPFLAERGKAGLEIIGGSVWGEVSQTLDWTEAYVNSAAVMLRDTHDATLRGWTITKPWDGIRIAGASDGFKIEGVFVSDARDDAVENDDACSGAIRDSLFDGVFSGISLGNKNTPDRSDNVVEIDNVLLRMKSYLYKGETTHGSPMKMTDSSPALRITDSVFAIEDVDHIGDWRLDLAWDKMIESSGNVFLNLSDKPLPEDYPMPGEGWTVLQGQAARDYWDEARAEWIAARDGDAVVPDEIPLDDEMGGGEVDDAEIAAEILLDDTGELVIVDDFEPGLDKIAFKASVFTSLDAGSDGTLDASQFEIAARAGDPDDYVMYKWKTGELFYDADGSGAGAQIKIAQLEERLSLDHDDFLTV